MQFFYLGWQCNQDDLTNNFITQQEKPSFKLLARVIHEIPKPLQTVFMIFLLSREEEGKSVLLKTPYILYTRPRGTELELTWKLPSWGQVFMGQKSLGKCLVGETASSSQPSDFHTRNEPLFCIFFCSFPTLSSALSPAAAWLCAWIYSFCYVSLLLNV